MGGKGACGVEKGGRWARERSGPLALARRWRRSLTLPVRPLWLLAISQKEQLMSFYHSSAEVVQAEGGEAYMQLSDADLWAVRSGDVTLYGRVVGCSSLQQSRSLAHSTLRGHLNRRKDRSSLIAIRPARPITASITASVG